MVLELVPARARASLAARHAGIGFLIHNLHRRAEGGCIDLPADLVTSEIKCLRRALARESPPVRPRCANMPRPTPVHCLVG